MGLAKICSHWEKTRACPQPRLGVGGDSGRFFHPPGLALFVAVRWFGGLALEGAGRRPAHQGGPSGRCCSAPWVAMKAPAGLRGLIGVL